MEIFWFSSIKCQYLSFLKIFTLFEARPWAVFWDKSPIIWVKLFQNLWVIRQISKRLHFEEIQKTFLRFPCFFDFNLIPGVTFFLCNEIKIRNYMQNEKNEKKMKTLSQVKTGPLGPRSWNPSKNILKEFLPRLRFKFCLIFQGRKNWAKMLAFSKACFELLENLDSEDKPCSPEFEIAKENFTWKYQNSINLYRYPACYDWENFLFLHFIFFCKEILSH